MALGCGLAGDSLEVFLSLYRKGEVYRPELASLKELRKKEYF